MRGVSFTVYGLPVPMARPRTCKTKEGKTITFNPDRSTAWKNAVAIQANAHRPKALYEGALSVSLVFNLLAPKRIPKDRPYPAGGDCDNYAKAVLDAMQGLLFRDDMQIVRLHIVKQYGHPTGVDVTITPADAAQEG